MGQASSANSFFLCYLLTYMIDRLRSGSCASLDFHLENCMDPPGHNLLSSLLTEGL